jgi:MscS family membrane protein
MSRCLRYFIVLLALLAAHLCTTSAAQQVVKTEFLAPVAQEEPDETLAQEKALQERIDAELERKLGSPQAMMQTFLETMNSDRKTEAAQCLDLSELAVTAEVRKAKEEELAYKLKEVLDRLVRIDISVFSTDPPTDDPISLNASGHDIRTEDQLAASQIILARSTDGLWRFSPETVAAIEPLYEEYAEQAKVRLTIDNQTEEPFSIRLANLFPVSMRKTHFLIADYQWFSLAIVALLGFAADWLTRLILSALTSAYFRFRARTKPPRIRGMWRPVGLLMQGVTWYFATYLIGLPIAVLNVLLIGLKFFAVVVAVWTGFHIIDLLARIALRQTAKTDTRFDDLLVPLVSKSLKVLAACIGFVLCASAFDWKITGLLGGLGIGGMALAFASQDAISNLFGSLTVLTDRPFEVGDWIVTEGVEGEVETVGFRSTRIRTFYNSIVTLPNSHLTTAAVDNMGRRKYRRFKTTLGVQYDTKPEQLEAFCEGVREILRRHPYTRKDYFHVYFNDFSASSLDILLYCFFECPDWSTELRERHRLLVDIMKLADRLGVEFAFPTRTLHMFQGEASASNLAADCTDPLCAGQTEAARIVGSFPVSEAPPSSG